MGEAVGWEGEREGVVGSLFLGFGFTVLGLGFFGAKEGGLRFLLFFFRFGIYLD